MRLAYQNVWVTFWLLLVDQLDGVRWFHVHRCVASHAPLARLLSNEPGYAPGATSSLPWGRSSSFVSAQAWTLGPVSVVAPAVRNGARSTPTGDPPSGAPGWLR
jgi:hypothetical protein